MVLDKENDFETNSRKIYIFTFSVECIFFISFFFFFLQFWEWFIQLRSPSDINKYHADYFKMEMCCFMTAALTLIHGNIHFLIHWTRISLSTGV